MSNILRRVKGSADKNYSILENQRQDIKCITVNDIEKYFAERIVERSDRKSNPKFLKPITKGRSPALA